MKARVVMITTQPDTDTHRQFHTSKGGIRERLRAGPQLVCNRKGCGNDGSGRMPQRGEMRIIVIQGMARGPIDKRRGPRR